MKGSEFVFDFVHLLYCKCHKINPNCSESNIISPDWIKKQKATINLINKKYNKCFQYSVTVTLNYEEMKKDPQRIRKLKPFTNKCNWEGISFPSEKDDWKRFDKRNVTMALNILHPLIVKRCARDEVVWVGETVFWVGGGELGYMGHYFG